VNRPGELEPAADSVQQETPGPGLGSNPPVLVAQDLDVQRVLREARCCLDEVIADIADIAAVLANYKAWLAVPEFLRGERDRVFWQGTPFEPD
jgi:hypothetical protein